MLAELSEIRSKIADWGSSKDTLTKGIDDWEKNFTKALNTKGVDEEAVCNSYIAMLQDLLRDPLTQAPLDEGSVLGNDGFTYGKMSLAVYQSTAPDEYQTCAPLNLSILSFTTTDHEVVRHMIKWLSNHNALLYSEVVKQAYDNLQHQKQQSVQVNSASNESQKQERVHRLIAKQKEREAKLAKMKKEQAAEFKNRVISQLGQWEINLKEKAKPLSPSLFSKKTEESVQNFSRQTKEIKDSLKNLKDKQVKDVTEIAERLKKAEQKSAEITGIAALDFESALDDKVFFDNLKQQIEEKISLKFQPLQQQLNEFTQATDKKLSALSQKFNEEKKALEAHIQSQEENVKKLEMEMQQLSYRQQYLSQEIHQLEKDQIALQQNIYELRIAIEKQKEKNSKAFYKTFAVFGACVFGTWAVQCFLSSTPVQISFFPSGKGIGSSTTVNL